MTNLSGQVYEVFEVEGGGFPMGYEARGHVDKCAFAAEILAEYERTADTERVNHIWVRNTPWHGPDGWVMVVNPAKGPGRGAYAVTGIEHGWTEEAAT